MLHKRISLSMLHPQFRVNRSTTIHARRMGCAVTIGVSPRGKGGKHCSCGAACEFLQTLRFIREEGIYAGTPRAYAKSVYSFKDSGSAAHSRTVIYADFARATDPSDHDTIPAQ